MSSDESEDDIGVSEARSLVAKVNRKKKKAGGFQAMGLSQPIFNGITHKGYKVPTPIQRKVIPVILSGRDLVAMARTGSGKTAAFLIPILERLRVHQNTGARALLLSPTRELAMQTLTFTKEIGKYTGLVAAVIVGGDKMDDQFMAIHQNPDIIIATPGRLLHVIMEMNLTLKSIEYVVFDEGDRLFEMGFADQLTETLHRLPPKRQTLVFSATLPSALLEFARAGLSDPALIRLDVDTKLSSLLKLAFVSCLSYEKEALLLHLLQTVIPPDEQSFIFCATKHHVDYLELLLKEFGVDCATVHSGLDPVARVMAVSSFREGKVRCLLVTDLAARGIDVPLLDNVINFHFPGQPKLFVHRVGRVARAGRTGLSISLVDSDELPYLMDLFVFLGRQVITVNPAAEDDDPTVWPNELLASCPRDLLAQECESISKQEKMNAALEAASPVCKRALNKYIQTRPRASGESVRKAKDIRADIANLQPHPLFSSELHQVDKNKEAILQILRNRKLPTIFEALGKHANPKAFNMMMRKRKVHDGIIIRAAERQALKKIKLDTVDEAPVTLKLVKQKEEIAPAIGSDFFVPSARADEATERCLSTKSQEVGGPGFTLSAQAACFDVQGDEVGLTHGRPAGVRKSLQVWDRKKKRFVNSDVAAGKGNVARIKTESGVFIPASYKTDQYETWLKRSKAYMEENGGQEREEKSLCVPSKSIESKKIGNSGGSRLPFANLFNARYGSVVEFMDDENDENKVHRRPSSTRWPTKKGSQPGGNAGQQSERTGLKVVGTMPKFARSQKKQEERTALEAQKGIKQARGSRTFGQMRKPEQILKLRRKRDQQEQFRQRNAAAKRGGLPRGSVGKRGRGGGAQGMRKGSVFSRAGVSRGGRRGAGRGGKRGR